MRRNMKGWEWEVKVMKVAGEGRGTPGWWAGGGGACTYIARRENGEGKVRETRDAGVGLDDVGVFPQRLALPHKHQSFLPCR